MSDKECPLYIAALARGLRILDVFRDSGPTMSLTEMALATAMTKSATQRSLYTLQALGYLEKEVRTKRYRLTIRTLEIGHSYLSSNTLIARANPHLHALNSLCGETCSLSEPYGEDMVNVARFPAQKSLYVYFPIGQHFPMYCSSAGRAYLSALPRSEADALLDRSERTRRTENTITEKQALLRLIQTARQQGFAWANGEFYPGDINVGAAILARSGRPIGTVNISVPSSRWSVEAACRELGPRVLEVTRAISGEVRQLHTLP